MIRGSKEAADSSTNEGSRSDGKITKISSSSPSTWLRLKDPRIVRVSRAFGGKDRHSKVTTIRGLRDRRVRLSVPTAIQLYDLQDRLGLNQPSKVVDWLLNAAKQEIDELPPLPVPPGNLGLNHHQMLSSQVVGASQSNKEGFLINSNINWEDPEGLPKSNVWSSNSLWRGKSKVVERETINEKEKQDSNEEHPSEDSSINLLPRSHNSSLPGLLNSVVSCGSYFQLEPSNFPLSQLGSHGLTSQTEDLQNFSVVPLPSGSQLLVCPPGTTQPLFPSHVTASVEIDPRQLNHFQMLSSNPHNLFPNSLSPPSHSISQSMRPFPFGMTPRHLPSHNNSGSPSDKNQDFPSK